MMKAIRVHEFGGPEVLRMEELPVPSPGPGEILLKVEAIGVNPVETYQRSGSNPALALPWTPGSDTAGIVDDVGPGVEGWEPGDRAYTSATVSGAYAMWTVAPAASTHRLPDQLSPEQGAAIGIPYATAWRALVQRAAARSGESVLVHGASGGVGLAAVQIARSLGLRVIGTAGTPQGAELVRAQGADHVLDHTSAGYLDALPGLTDGAGPAIILEMLANVNLAHDARAIAKRGRIIVIGCRGPIEINPRDLMAREADVRGLLLFNSTPDELAAIHSGLAEGLSSGALTPVVNRAFPLADAARAHAAVLKPGASGKIVLLP
jgi:NADPH:quinone reductase